MGEIAVFQAAVRARGSVRKCLACGHDNSTEDNACAACGSSLELQLCPACEAINSSHAVQCHACGVELAAGRKLSSRPVSLPAEGGRSKKKAQLVALIGLPLCATFALAYFTYEHGAKGATEPPVSQVEGKTTAVVTDSIPVSTPAAASSTNDKTAGNETPAKARLAREAKTASSSDPDPRAGQENLSVNGSEQHLTIPTSAGRKDGTPRGGAAAKVSTREAHSTSAAGSRPRVTHTKGFNQQETPAPAAAPSGAAELRPAAAVDVKAADACGEAVTVLGLCNTQGGK